MMVLGLCLVDGNITAQKYINILYEHLRPVIARHFSDKPYLFQDDNAPVNRARITCEYKVNNAARLRSPIDFTS